MQTDTPLFDCLFVCFYSVNKKLCSVCSLYFSFVSHNASRKNGLPGTDAIITMDSIGVFRGKLQFP